MIEQFSNSIKATLYDRISSPLSSGFIISWCLWNYKFLIVLFSSMKPYDKYSELDIITSNSVIKISGWDPLGYLLSNGLAFPLISAVAFIILYPIPSEFMYKYWLKSQNKLRDARNEIEKTLLLSVDESAKIKRVSFEQEKHFLDLISIKDKMIEDSKIQNESLTAHATVLKEKNHELTGKLNELNEKHSTSTKELSEITEVCNEMKRENADLNSKLKVFNDSEISLLRLSGEKSDEKQTKSLDFHLPNRLQSDIFMALVSNGSLRSERLKEYVSSENNQLSINIAIRKLVEQNYITMTGNDELRMTKKGEDLAVFCGLA
ncbi:hypothetical protein ACRN9F_11220 [Shewanella oncorhynchi]|uniref:hypothetical protein n=1 Tax=Shewanella oncorhynchi TaxID=2726434 RepID=UPI003D7B888E